VHNVGWERPIDVILRMHDVDFSPVIDVMYAANKFGVNWGWIWLNLGF